MTHKLSLQIEFYDNDQSAIRIASTTPQSLMDFGETLLLVAYTLRQMSNLGNRALELASFLKDGENYSWVAKIHMPLKYQGIPGKRGFSGELEFSEDAAYFISQFKGFGILGVGLNTYVPLSVALLMAFLIKQRGGDSKYKDRLGYAASLCAKAYFDKEVTFSSQPTLAVRVTNEAFRVYLSDEETNNNFAPVVWEDYGFTFLLPVDWQAIEGPTTLETRSMPTIGFCYDCPDEATMRFMVLICKSGSMAIEQMAELLESLSDGEEKVMDLDTQIDQLPTYGTLTRKGEMNYVKHAVSKNGLTYVFFWVSHRNRLQRLLEIHRQMTYSIRIGKIADDLAL